MLETVIFVFGFCVFTISMMTIFKYVVKKYLSKEGTFSTIVYVHVCFSSDAVFASLVEKNVGKNPFWRVRYGFSFESSGILGIL